MKLKELVCSGGTCVPTPHLDPPMYVRTRPIVMALRVIPQHMTLELIRI